VSSIGLSVKRMEWTEGRGVHACVRAFQTVQADKHASAAPAPGRHKQWLRMLLVQTLLLQRGVCLSLCVCGGGGGGGLWWCKGG
jgi:hypothetical protein